MSAAVYGVRSLYFKARQDFGEYYKAALKHLCYVSTDAMPAEERESLARDIALAALLADSIYSFADLLMHPLVRRHYPCSLHICLARLSDALAPAWQRRHSCSQRMRCFKCMLPTVSVACAIPQCGLPSQYSAQPRSVDMQSR